MNTKEIDSIMKAGKIAKEVKIYANSFIKPKIKLVEIAEKIEEKILTLGGKIAFPVNLSINEFTAHFTPEINEETIASGLLKVDFGVAINGFVADNAFSLDMENNEKNKKLIKTSEEALEKAIEYIEKEKSLGEIGEGIQSIAEKNGFSPIKNLSGHGIMQNELHCPPNIPNFNNGNTNKLNNGIYAIEPFITSGIGEVYDGKPSGIYELKSIKNVRDLKARELLKYILENYGTLPFCSRWIVKKFGTRALISLKNLEEAKILHHFHQLVEKSKSPVAQSEATIIIIDRKVEIIT
ncbi:MAG: type II methionyl aminopeptidase [Candidatus Pacearchaeota archaeon]